MVVALALLLLFAQTPVWDDDDRKTIPEPKERQIANVYDFTTAALLEPMAQLADVPRDVRKLFRAPREAGNVNRIDEVPNSSWFTNRNFWKPMSQHEIGEGPGQTAKPPDSGPWTITKCKLNGVSPGFQIRDHKGDTYLLKFDPHDYLELATAADVVGSRFMHAAGYNVPANFIVTFEETILHPKDGLTCSIHGANIPMTKGAMAHFLEDVPRTKSGLLRAMASKFIEGKIKGPFSYQGVRADDPNDRVPHEHRRELRGLRVISAFINNIDMKQLNTLDTFVDEDGRRFLKHYLIDFGDAFGSASTSAKRPGEGHEYIFDTGEVLKSTFSFGLYRRADTRPAPPVQYPSIGFIEGETFDPAGWKTNSPNPAFENITKRDGYWGAKIVAAFTDEQIAAAVHTGQYSDPAAERNLVEILKARRNRIADYWFRRVAPLDRFRVTARGLTFDDLAIESNRDRAANVKYTVIVHSATNTVPIFEVAPGTAIPIDVADTPTEARITRVSRGWPDLKVTVVVQRIDGVPAVIGIRR